MEDHNPAVVEEHSPVGVGARSLAEVGGHSPVEVVEQRLVEEVRLLHMGVAGPPSSYCHDFSVPLSTTQLSTGCDMTKCKNPVLLGSYTSSSPASGR